MNFFENKKNETEYLINLDFYKVLKGILKCNFSNVKLIDLKETILMSKNTCLDFFSYKKSILEIINFDSNKYLDFSNLINLIEDFGFDKWISFVDLGIDLMYLKNFIIKEAKYSINEYYNDKKINATDKLSLNYDSIGLEIPYGQRVLSSLLFELIWNNKIINDIHQYFFNQEFIQKKLKMIRLNLEKVSKKYQIKINNIFFQVLQESLNQSIKSDAGINYENRVYQSLLNVADSINKKRFDSKNKMIEYDFCFNIENIKFGVSVKRTLRERHKQNWSDPKNLDVDYIILFTLGLDLNSSNLIEKLLNIPNAFIVVASEIYNKNQYLKRYKNIISSLNFNRETLLKLVNEE